MGYFSKGFKFAQETWSTGGGNLLNTKLDNPFGDITGANLVSAENKAEKESAKATREAIAEQNASRLSTEERIQPFTDIGLESAQQLQNLLANPNQGIEEINPIVSFLRDQGFEGIQESAAAEGRLGAGDTLKDLTQFNSDLTSTVVPQLQNQRFNQLFNVAGMGVNAATGQNQATLQTGTNISNLLSQGGQNKANSTINAANTKAAGTNNLLNTVASLYGASSGSAPQTGQAATTQTGASF